MSQIWQNAEDSNRHSHVQAQSILKTVSENVLGFAGHLEFFFLPDIRLNLTADLGRTF